MSRIGKLPIEIKQTVTVSVEGNVVTMSSPKGTLSFTIPAGIGVVLEDGKLVVKPTTENPQLSALWGTTRARLANMHKGLDSGFEKKLELSGVGYRAQTSGSNLTLSVGFSHPVKIDAPKGIQFTVADNIITVAGADKADVGDVAARIRAIRPPEPYKGKGIKYQGERIRRKAGKAAKAVGGK